jgi:hypothetical protein
MLVGEKCKDVKVLFCWATNHTHLEEYTNTILKDYPEYELIGIDLTTGKYTKKENKNDPNSPIHEGSFMLTMSVIKKGD